MIRFLKDLPCHSSILCLFPCLLLRDKTHSPITNVNFSLLKRPRGRTMPPLISRLLRGMTHTFCPLTAPSRGDAGIYPDKYSRKRRAQRDNALSLFPEYPNIIVSRRGNHTPPARNRAPGSERETGAWHSCDQGLNTAQHETRNGIFTRIR